MPYYFFLNTYRTIKKLIGITITKTKIGAIVEETPNHKNRFKKIICNP